MFSEPDRERGEGGGEVMAGSASLLSGAPRGAKRHKYKIQSQACKTFNSRKD